MAHTRAHRRGGHPTLLPCDEFWLGWNGRGEKEILFKISNAFLSSTVSSFLNPVETSCYLGLILQNEIQYVFYLIFNYVLNILSQHLSILHQYFRTMKT
jgi:hypothetical protein